MRKSITLTLFWHSWDAKNPKDSIKFELSAAGEWPAYFKPEDHFANFKKQVNSRDNLRELTSKFIKYFTPQIEDDRTIVRITTIPASVSETSHELYHTTAYLLTPLTMEEMTEAHFLLLHPMNNKANLV